MFEKLKIYCEEELKDVDYDPNLLENASLLEACTRAYGAVMFVCSIASDEEEDKIGKWWNDVMREKFYSRLS